MSVNHRFDALHVFGAVMRWNPKKREWCFPLVLEEWEYAGRLVLGEWRAKAAVVLKDSAPVILVTGGSNKHPETDEPCWRAMELAKVIVGYGVPSEKVIPIGKIDAGHTLGNVANLTEYLRSNPSIRRIGMVCPRFQMLRAMVMQYRDPFYIKNGIELEWIEVERTLIKTSILTNAEVDNIYTSPEADICWQMEQNGMKNLLLGCYQPKPSA